MADGAQPPRRSGRLLALLLALLVLALALLVLTLALLVLALLAAGLALLLFLFLVLSLVGHLPSPLLARSRAPRQPARTGLVPGQAREVAQTIWSGCVCVPGGRAPSSTS